MSDERKLCNLLRTRRCDRSVDSARTAPFDRRFRSRHRDIRKCIRQKINRLAAKSDVENANATALLAHSHACVKRSSRAFRQAVSEGGSFTVDSQPESTRVASPVSYVSGNEIENAVSHTPTESSYKFRRRQHTSSASDEHLPDVEWPKVKSPIDQPNDAIDTFRTSPSSSRADKTSLSSGKSSSSSVERETSPTLPNEFPPDRNSPPASRRKPMVNVYEVSHLAKIRPEKSKLAKKLNNDRHCVPKSRVKPTVNEKASRREKIRCEKSNRPEKVETRERDDLPQSESIVNATNSSHSVKIKLGKSISPEKLDRNRDRTPELKCKPYVSDTELIYNRKSEAQPKNGPSEKTRSHRKRSPRKRETRRASHIPVQTDRPSAYDVISNFSRLLNTLKAQAKHERRLASRRNLLPAKYLNECPASIALISSTSDKKLVNDEQVADECLSDSDQAGEEACADERAAKRADGKHIHPCICDLTGKQREKIERHLREKLAAQRRYERRVQEIEAEIRHLEEEEEAKRQQRALEHELYEEEYEMVGKRKKRKKRSARRVSMVSIGVKQRINWRKSPKIDVKYTKTYELRKENTTYCGPKFDKLLVPQQITIAEIPSIPIRQTRASALRTKYTRKYLETVKKQREVKRKYPNKPEFVLKVY